MGIKNKIKSIFKIKASDEDLKQYVQAQIILSRLMGKDVDKA